MQERIDLITEQCLASGEKDPIRLFYKIAGMDFVRMHGPEHHFLDGACILTAFYNAGGKVELKDGLQSIAERSLKMPGAMCGHWGVCGAVTSMGAALSVIDGTGPLSGDDWGKHMQYTSRALSALAVTGGPRCCKRDAFFAFRAAVEYVNENYDVVIPLSEIKCSFSKRNEQCLEGRCPFYAKN
ncbi:MAG: hypothetical protein IJ519_04450 [Clostridia bacterium]|nr:hypothetical protein [Clostridia bacterium]